MQHPIGAFSESAMQKIRDMIDANIIVGDPIQTDDGVTVIPVSRVSFGFASGGADYTKPDNKAAGNTNFGAGTGSGVSIVPVGFLIIKNGDAKVVSMTGPAPTALDRLLDIVPQTIEKITEMVDKKDKDDDQKA